MVKLTFNLDDLEDFRDKIVLICEFFLWGRYVTGLYVRAQSYQSLLYLLVGGL